MTLEQFLQIQQEIKEAITHGELSEGFTLSLTYFQNNSRHDDLVLQSNSYKTIDRQYRTGTIKADEYRQECVQLTNGLLGFLRHEYSRLKRQEANNLGTSTPVIDLENDYKLAFARVSIFWIFQNAQDETASFTTTECYSLSKLENRKYIAVAIQEMVQADWLQKSKNEKGVVFSLTKKGRAIAAKWNSSALF